MNDETDDLNCSTNSDTPLPCENDNNEEVLIDHTENVLVEASETKEIRKVKKAWRLKTHLKTVKLLNLKFSQNLLLLYKLLKYEQ